MITEINFQCISIFIDHYINDICLLDLVNLYSICKDIREIINCKDTNAQLLNFINGDFIRGSYSKCPLYRAIKTHNVNLLKYFVSLGITADNLLHYNRFLTMKWLY